jgi:flagellar hook-associated protein FlgK
MNISNNITSIRANQTVLNTTANNIANVNTNDFVPQKTIVSNNLTTQTNFADNTGSKKSQTSLDREMPDLIIEEKVNAVNVSAIKTQDEMFGTLLDIKS